MYSNLVGKDSFMPVNAKHSNPGRACPFVLLVTASHSWSLSELPLFVALKQVAFCPQLEKTGVS